MAYTTLFSSARQNCEDEDEQEDEDDNFQTRPTFPLVDKENVPMLD